jgi:nitrite reductase/ring-hydroxylating ferredoxin subunit
MVTIRMLTITVMLTMISFVESWSSSASLAPHCRQQLQPLFIPQRRLAPNRRVAYSNFIRPILTCRQAKRDDDDNVKGGIKKSDVEGIKKSDAKNESPGYLRSLGNFFSFNKSNSTAAAKDDKKKVLATSNSTSTSSWWSFNKSNSTAAAKDDKKKDSSTSSSNSTSSWWPWRKANATEAQAKAEAKIPKEGPVDSKQRGNTARSASSSSSVKSSRPSTSPAKTNKSPPPPSVNRSKEGIVRDKKVATSTSSIKEAANVTSIENPSLANRFQSVWNSTMQWNILNQQLQERDGNLSSANKTGENPLSGAIKFFGSAATDLKQKSEQDWGGYLGNAQKFVLDAASGGMKRFTKSADDSEEWLPVFPKTRISPGEMVPATIADIDVLVIASSDGRKLYCIANSCPHLGTPLETGLLERRPIESNPSIKSTTNTDSTDTDDDKPYLISEMEVMSLLQQDGCEDCIVCPLHHTAFALSSGQVRGEWCPYPPVIGKIMGTVNPKNPAAVFDIRYKGKNVEVRLNTPTDAEDEYQQRQR